MINDREDWTEMEHEKADIKKRMQYILNMRPVFNKEALFSDGTEYYRIPAEPKAGDTVTIKFRTQRNNVDSVYLVSQEQRVQMEICGTENGFDYYSAQVTIGADIFRYYFEIQYGWVTCYYNNQGVCMKHEGRMDFEIYPGFDTPKWAKGAVMYQIYVDRFLNGDPTNDVVTGEYHYIGDKSVQVEQWNKIPAVIGVREFYGGDLQGIMNKLDYLQDLGVEVIYLNPIFVSPSNHKYDCQDYDYVDPHYGRIVEDCNEGILLGDDDDNSHAWKYIKRVTDKKNLEASNELFAKLTAEIHRRGMKIILDGVFNHCGSFNKWMDRERIYENQEGYPKGAYVSADSPYRNFFSFNDPNAWPYNTSYDGWWAHDTSGTFWGNRYQWNKGSDEEAGICRCSGCSRRCKPDDFAVQSTFCGTERAGNNDLFCLPCNRTACQETLSASSGKSGTVCLYDAVSCQLSEKKISEGRDCLCKSLYFSYVRVERLRK